MIAEDRQIGYYAVRPGSGRQADGLARTRPSQEAGRCDKVDFGDKALLAVAHDGNRPPAMRTDVVPAAAPRQANLWMIMVADGRRVQVAVGIDLGSAEEAVFDEPALGCFNHVQDAAGGEGAVERPPFADGARQVFQNGPDASELEDQHQVWGVHALRQHRRQHRDAGADEGRCPVLH